MHQVGFLTSVSIRILQDWRKFKNTGLFSSLLFINQTELIFAFLSVCLLYKYLYRLVSLTLCPRYIFISIYLALDAFLLCMFVIKKLHLVAEPLLAFVLISTTLLNLFTSLSCWLPASASQTQGPQAVITLSAHVRSIPETNIRILLHPSQYQHWEKS